MAQVIYKISGKHDAKGMNAARKSLDSLKGAADKVNVAFKAFVGAKVIGGLTDAVKGSMQAFSEAQASSTKLFQSVRNNSNLAAGAFGRLTALTAKFQGVTMFDADDLNAQAAFLSGMNLTEDQIAATMEAAIEMASAGVMPLDSAVKNLAKTFNGSAGELGEMNGKIKSLTKDQLKNGEAVKILAQQYKGYSTAMANTPIGKLERMKIALGDIKETIGLIPAGLQEMTFDKLISGTKTFKEKLGEGINVLFIAFENLPEAGKIVFDALGKMFARVFSWDFIGQVLTVCCNQIGRMFTALFDGIKKGFTSIWDTAAFNKDLKQKLEKQQITVNLAYQAKDAKSKELEGKGIVNDYWKRNGADNPEWVKQMAAVNANLEKEQAELKRLQNIEQKNYSAAVWDGISTAITEAAKGTGESLKELGTILDENLGDILRDVPEAIKGLSPDGKSKTLQGLSVAGTPPTTEDSTTEDSTTNFGDQIMSQLGGLSGLIGMFGQLGQAINAIMSGNPIGLIIQAITSLVGALSGIENFGKVMNVFGTIFGKVAEVIEPVVNDALAPLVVIFEDVGRLIGTILAPAFKIVGLILQPICQLLHTVFQILTPFLELFGIIAELMFTLNPLFQIFTFGLNVLAKGIAWIYNAIIRPIANFIISLMTGFMNFLITLWNGIVDLFNMIKLPNVRSVFPPRVSWTGLGSMLGLSKKGHIDAGDYTLKEISVNDGTTADSGSGSSSSSSGASYSAASDVYVTINFDRSYVNGDAREISIMLRNEIRSAEKLGM